jgi:hypothetical protein
LARRFFVALCQRLRRSELVALNVNDLEWTQTRHKSIDMLRVYCRDAELFVGKAAAGLL